MRGNGPIQAILAVALLAGPAFAQEDPREAAGLFAPSAWDLELGAHAFELPVDEYIDYACGTNGGPPSLPVSSWADFALCAPEAISGFHEIYFQYDDENEYWAKAMDLGVQTRIFEHTSAYQIPVIASALFDGEGFLVGIRLITDPRVDVVLRENGVILSNFLRARYGEGWVCEDLPRIEGEREYQGLLEKRRCNLAVPDEGFTVMLETHNYRKPGQFAVDPRTRRATEGQFVSSTLYELVLLNAQEGQGREPPPEMLGPSEMDVLVARAMNCPGCDFQGANFKRADLRGANLSGANLEGANFHAAFLGGADLSNANLFGANFNRADVKRANLNGANIQEAMMYEARFDGASLVGADLTLTNAPKVQFIRADLTDARMVAMDLRNARMNDATIIHADLSGSLLWDAVLTRSDLSRVIILQADMPRAEFINANLSDADLRGSQMINVNFRGANLTNVDFSAANLNLSNFSEAILDGAVWVNAILPGGFQPN